MMLGLVWKKADCELSKTPGQGLVTSTHSATKVTVFSVFDGVQLILEVILDLL